MVHEALEARRLLKELALDPVKVINLSSLTDINGGSLHKLVEAADNVLDLTIEHIGILQPQCIILSQQGNRECKKQDEECATHQYYDP